MPDNRKAPGDRTKKGPTPKQVKRHPPRRIRQVTGKELALFSRGIYSRVTARDLNVKAIEAAMHDAIYSMTDTPELQALIAVDNESDWLISMDRLAARAPDDARWDTWRAHRKGLLADAN